MDNSNDLYRLRMPKTAAFLVTAVVLTVCCTFPGCARLPGPTAIGKLQDVQFFACQIQDQDENGNIKLLADSLYDLLIIDQTRSLKGDEEYDSKGDVATLKRTAGANGNNKIVICYLDIGEAESYRWYWEEDWKVGRPEWIVAEDPDGWDENFPVKFWRDEWACIMKNAIDMIITDGYDGIYLDWLEVYSFDPVMKAAEEEELEPAEALVDFVGELAAYARSRKPGFIIVAQNATELYEEPGYAGLLDGVAQEAVWFDGGGDPDTGKSRGDIDVDPELTEEYLQNLAAWKKMGKTVLDIEYAGDPVKAKKAYELGARYKFKTYVTLRPLDTLTNTPPPRY